MKYCIAIGANASPTVPVPIAGDFVQSIRLCHQLGYQAVEIHTPDPGALQADALSEVCSELGMEIATLGTGMIYGLYRLSLMDPDRARRQEIVARVNAYVDVASRLNSRVTVGSIKGNVPKGADRQQHLAWMGECLQEITGYAGNQGVDILLEATNRYENNVFNTAEETREFIEDNRLRHTLILLDSFHINIEEKRAYDCLRDAGEYLGHIHFADNTRWYPGSGSFNFAHFCQHIRDIGYDGVLSVEALPLPDGLTAAQESLAFFRRHFG